MNHTKYLALAALVMAFSACDDIEDSTSLPQTNPQLPGVDAANVVVLPGADAAAPIDLGAFNAADSYIRIASVATPSDWPEGFVPEVPMMQMSASQSFADCIEVTTTMGADGEVLIAPDTWDGVWKKAFGRNPAQRTLYLRFPVYAVKGSQSVRMGGLDTWYGAETVTVAPFNEFDHTIEDTYYVVGSFCGWDLARGVKLDHSGYDPYDDPNFHTLLSVDGAGYEFVVVPASTVAAGTLSAGYYGGEYPAFTDADGMLLASTDASTPASLLIDHAGSYELKINMETLAYSYQSAFSLLYTPGNSNGWNQEASQVLTSADYKWFSGYVHLDGEFKFTTAPNWDGTNYGAGATPGTLDPTGGNLSAPANALYYATVSIPELTYSLTEITTLGIIGSATPAGWDGQTNLTPSADFLTWTGILTLTDGEFKFRMNDNWDINLGGSVDALIGNGANIPVAAGTYLVTLDFSSVPYTCTLTPQ